jgi:hypothetical protein
MLTIISSASYVTQLQIDGFSLSLVHDFGMAYRAGNAGLETHSHFHKVAKSNRAFQLYAVGDNGPCNKLLIARLRYPRLYRVVVR